MRSEWRHFWRHLYKLTRGSFVWSSVLVAVFFVIYMPILTVNQYWMSFKICLGYGASVFFYIVTLYAIANAFWTIRKIRYKFDRKLPTPLSFAIGTTASCLGVAQGSYIKAALLGYPPRYEEITFSGLIGFFIGLMFLFRGLYRDTKINNDLLKSANTEAELHVFKNQMQPHFLFNSLNSLLSLIETNSADAPLMTQKLANLYREILESSNQNMATLASELSIIEKYLSLERYRFGDRLGFTLTAPENAEAIFLPPLVLQTLVENAVKHGIGHVLDRGAIEVEITPGDGGYLALVKNTGNLGDITKLAGTGIRNSRARLNLIYGRKNNFQIEQAAEAVQVSFWFSGESLQ